MKHKEHIEALLIKELHSKLSQEERSILLRWRTSEVYDSDYEKQIITTHQLLQTDQQLLQRYPPPQLNRKQAGLIKHKKLVTLLAALFVISLLGVSFLGFFTNYGKGITISTSTYQKKGTLPDGSSYIMDSYSELKLNKNFGTTNRILYCKGQVYFDVAKQNNSRFQVRLPDKSEINVLGTQFTVNTNKKDHSETYLIEGRLLWKSPSKKEKQMVTGNLLHYNRKKKEWKLSKNDHLFEKTLWKNKPFQFKNQPLAQIILEIATYFGSKISLENKTIGRQKITAQFSRDLQLEEILDLLSKASNFDYFKEQHTGQWIIKQYKRPQKP